MPNHSLPSRTTPPLTSQEFDQICRLIHAAVGLDLKKGKEELVSSRLAKYLRQSEFRSFQDYYRHVVSEPSGEALSGLIDALTTNFTSFLREPSHFEVLRTSVLPKMRGRHPIRIWSAGCATGEEPYSIAFSLLDSLPRQEWPRIRILASDVSVQALCTAEHAVYRADCCRDLPPAWLRKYFLAGERGPRGSYRVSLDVRSLVRFRRINLIDSYSHPAVFAVIFFRNVLIYFNKSTQQKVLDALMAWLEPGGYLFLGHAESLTGMNHAMKYIQPSVYRKPARLLPGAGRIRWHGGPP